MDAEIFDSVVLSIDISVGDCRAVYCENESVLKSRSDELKKLCKIMICVLRMFYKSPDEMTQFTAALMSSWMVEINWLMS